MVYNVKTTTTTIVTVQSRNPEGDSSLSDFGTGGDVTHQRTTMLEYRVSRLFQLSQGEHSVVPCPEVDLQAKSSPSRVVTYLPPPKLVFNFPVSSGCPSPSLLASCAYGILTKSQSSC